MRYHLNSYTNWVRQCKTQAKACFLLGIKLRLPFLKLLTLLIAQNFYMPLHFIVRD
jgi:hypothetical protein